MLECKIIDIADGCKQKLDLKKYPVTTVKEFYKWESLGGECGSKFIITPEQAIKINLGEITARNAFYFANIGFFRGYVRKKLCSRSKYNELKIEEFDDTIQQIYIDLPYYNFTNRKTFLTSLHATVRLTPYGGITNFKEYYRAVKISKTISLYHECRYKKSGNNFYLLDVIADNMPSPEDLAIRAEEHADEKEDENYYKFEQILKHDIINHSNAGYKTRMRLYSAIM